MLLKLIFGGFSHLKYGYVKNICLSFLATMGRVIVLDILVNDPLGVLR